MLCLVMAGGSGIWSSNALTISRHSRHAKARKITAVPGLGPRHSMPTIKHSEAFLVKCELLSVLYHRFRPHILAVCRQKHEQRRDRLPRGLVAMDSMPGLRMLSVN